MNYSIISMNPDKGVAIVSDENGKFSAMVNGKLYRVTDYRPVDGNGRQLRNDSIEVIKGMMPAARADYDAREVLRKAEFETAVMEAQKAAAPAPKSFAEVLEQSFISTLTEKTSGEMVEAMYPTLERMLIEKFGIIPRVHEIKIPEKAPVKIKGVLHSDFDKIVGILNLNADEFGFGVYMCGPAGTGKSYLAKQIAAALGLEYYYTASIVDDIQLKGFIDANGRYHETQFYKAFTNGGVFLLDELDASVPETLVLLNNALANGYFDFPTGRTDAHPDFRCLAAGNTFGTGADSTYTGRYCLDQSSMDRFSLITVNYDREIELAMADGDSSLADFARDFRAAVEKCGTQCLFTYRGIKRLAKFSGFMDKPDAIRIGLTKGLAADDIRTIYDNMTVSNEWREALRKLF